jgi:hypothetical protein
MWAHESDGTSLALTPECSVEHHIFMVHKEESK